MPSYAYIAVDKTGKEKKASIEADTLDQVNLRLRKEGLIPIEVKEVGLLGKDIQLSFHQNVKPRDLSVFCRQFVSMVGAGVTIIDALGMLAEQTENKRLANATRATRTEVEKGRTLSEAMQRQGEIFPTMFINMVAAGETSGSIEIAFSRMASQFEKSAKLKGLMKKSLMYPAVLGVVATAIVIIMTTFVIPNYVKMFDGNDMQLPKITLAMLVVSDVIRGYWYLILAGLIAIIIGIREYKKTDSGAALFGYIAIHMPLFGKLNVKIYSAQFARTMSTMMFAGIPMIDAIDSVSKTMKNVLFKRQLQTAREEVAKGVPLSEPLKYGKMFPPMVIHMLFIGEETGEIETMLDNLANYYDEEVEMTTQTVMAAMEPLIIVVMAMIVLLLIASIMAPMLSMYDQLGNL